jgi:predicted nucleic acid-binding protein
MKGAKPMGLSCLTDSSARLVFDASTAINLNATGCAAKVLRALPHAAILTDVVLGELQEDSRNGRRDGDLVEKLIAADLLRVENIADLSQSIFEELVIGRGPNTLDDGEAATVAFAVENDLIPVLDERKARRICAERFATTKIASTIDLLCHDAVAASLGTDILGDAVFSALQNARMRVLPQHVNWVVTCIGPQRAAQCLSLPSRVRATMSTADSE